jgi:hypothetical protein
MSTAVRQAFGLRIVPAFPLPATPVPTGSEQPLVRIEAGLAGRRPYEALEPLWRTVIDREPVEVSRAGGGALEIAFGRQAAFRISADGTRVACFPRPDAEQARWQRFLLDTVLWCTALLHGLVAIHAGAVGVRSAAVAIVAGTGGGKTSLTAELLRRGAALLSDDVLVLTSTGTVLGHPAPPVMNLDGGTSAGQRRGIGRELATLDGEVWLEVVRAASGPTPLRAVFVLDRVQGALTAAVEPLDNPLVELMAHTVAIPGLPRAHARRRFDVLADIVDTVPVWSLRAPASLPPAALADLLEDALTSQGHRLLDR